MNTSITTTRASDGVRRILVGLDAGGAEMTALRAVASWAAQWRSELAGIFVEDVNLLHLSGYSFAREFATAYVCERALTGETVARRWRVHAEQARQVFMRAAAEWAVDVHFSVVRGRADSGMLSGVTEHDLVVVSNAEVRHDASCVKCAFRKLALGAPGPVLFLSGRPLRKTAPILCVVDMRSRHSGVAEMAARIAETERRPLHILVIGALEDLGKLEAHVVMSLQESALTLRLTRLQALDPSLLRQFDSALVVVSVHSGMDADTLREWARVLTQPILITK